MKKTTYIRKGNPKVKKTTYIRKGNPKVKKTKYIKKGYPKGKKTTYIKKGYPKRKRRKRKRSVRSIVDGEESVVLAKRASVSHVITGKEK